MRIPVRAQTAAHQKLSCASSSLSSCIPRMVGIVCVGVCVYACVYDVFENVKTQLSQFLALQLVIWTSAAATVALSHSLVSLVLFKACVRARAQTSTRVSKRIACTQKQNYTQRTHTPISQQTHTHTHTDTIARIQARAPLSVTLCRVERGVCLRVCMSANVYWCALALHACLPVCKEFLQILCICVF